MVFLSQRTLTKGIRYYRRPQSINDVSIYMIYELYEIYILIYGYMSKPVNAFMPQLRHLHGLYLLLIFQGV